MAAVPTSLAKVSLPIRLALGFFMVALTATAYWLIFYTEVSAKIDAATKQGNDLQAELGRQKLAQAGYFADRDELALRQQRQRDLNKALPADTEVAAFLSSIQTVSNVSGVDLKAWQPMDEKTEAFFSKVPMALELSGRFQQIAKFVHEVGKLDRIINVENIQLTDPKIEGDEVKLKAKCLATTFHVPHAAKPAVPAGAPK